ncbi:MAG: DUF1538 domain-containing protein [Gammaproteobacteria bacterium]|nr:DUF1538 domain-containing protein [Gammaproteobacteria bacterium]
MELVLALANQAVATVTDIVPIAVLFAIFQVFVLREGIAQLDRILIGILYVAIGLTLFRVGLAISLVPIGESMAAQLVESAVQRGQRAGWLAYVPLVSFAAAIGFTASLIEPTLIAVAERVRDLSGGTLRPWSLRLAVAVGIAAGLAVGTVRIVTGVPLSVVLSAFIVLVAVLALTAPKLIVPLALDSGGMATSAVTVPLIASFGIAAAESLPGRSALADGFGLIMLALLGPAAALLLFAQAYVLYQNWTRSGDDDAV